MKGQMKHRLNPKPLAGATLALLALISGCSANGTKPAATPAATPCAAPMIEAAPTWEPPIHGPSEDWDNGSLPETVRLLSVGLDRRTQWTIYSECDYDNALFCTVMAIGQHETGLDPEAVGDNGGSIGAFQINVKWHLDRMERLGVSDLTDPAQCAAVAIDYLQELERVYGYRAGTHSLFMAYNMGPKGARKALEAGWNATDYSREVMTLYQGFMEELEG